MNRSATTSPANRYLIRQLRRRVAELSAEVPYELHECDPTGAFDTGIRCGSRRTMLRIRDRLNDDLRQRQIINRGYQVTHPDAEGHWLEWRDEDEVPMT